MSGTDISNLLCLWSLEHINRCTHTVEPCADQPSAPVETDASPSNAFDLGEPSAKRKRSADPDIPITKDAAISEKYIGKWGVHYSIQKQVCSSK